MIIGSKIIVLGPSDIYWLNNIHHEVAYMRGGASALPDREHCRYFYPHLVRRKNVQLEHARAATLEMLTAPWVILSYINPKKQNRKGFVIFYRKRGESVDEFLYLIDYLMHYQVLVEDTDVFIKTLDEPEFKDLMVGIALQAYLPDSHEAQKKITEWAKNRVKNGGSPVRIRIVKGANMESEQFESYEKNFPLATYNQKHITDANHKKMIIYGRESTLLRRQSVPNDCNNCEQPTALNLPFIKNTDVGWEYHFFLLEKCRQQNAPTAGKYWIRQNLPSL